MSLTKVTYSMIQGAPANVLDFGAVGDGLTDDTAAFVAAIATNKAVYAPQGSYKINLVITTSNVTIFGDGIENTTFYPYIATNPVITINGDIPATILRNFVLKDVSIAGIGKQSVGLYIYNTSDFHGCDQLFLTDVSISQCSKGIGCYGRSIWSNLQNVFCDFNYDGIYFETDQAVNTWTFLNVRTSHNDRHGLYANKTDISISGFIDFTFINFNSEYNGEDTSIPLICGVYCNAAEGWSFQNITLEHNGSDLPGVESYGLLFEGNIGRGIVVDGAWAIQSKYLIAIKGVKKSGYINNIYRGTPYAGGYTVYIDAQWANTDEPKVELGPVIMGSVYSIYDINGKWPITQGVDTYGSPQTSVDFSYRKNVTIITTGGTSSISSITGLLSGDVIFLYNYSNGGANKITLASGLMATGVAYDVNPDTGKQFMVLGYPANGKLTPI